MDHDSAYAIYRGTIATNCAITSDYNDVFVAGGNAYVGNYSGTKCKTLANWRTASGQDAHSTNVNPANPFGATGQLTSLTNLHWVSAPSNAFAGTPIPGFTTDIDGQTRNATTPYMGADEAGPLTGVTPDDLRHRPSSLWRRTIRTRSIHQHRSAISCPRQVTSASWFPINSAGRLRQWWTSVRRPVLMWSGSTVPVSRAGSISIV